MIRSLQLFRFRSYTASSFTFSKGVTAIVGPNGIGKTNILEAIACTTLGRSFRTDTLKELIQENSDAARITLGFELEGLSHTIQYTLGERKEILYDHTSYKTFNNLLGLIPVGIVSPKDVVLIEGAPLARRKYLNQILCQTCPEYAFHLKRLTAILEQKNAALKNEQFNILDSFDPLFAASSAILQQKRQELITHLNLLLNEEITALLDPTETLTLTYTPSLFVQNSATREREIQRRMSLYGPQRDDFVIELNRKEASIHASEGQKRSLILALRFAELTSLERSTQKKPLLLIDDFGAHLDQKRKARLIERTQSTGQCILTAPSLAYPVDQCIDLEAAQIYAGLPT